MQLYGQKKETASTSRLHKSISQGLQQPLQLLHGVRRRFSTIF